MTGTEWTPEEAERRKPRPGETVEEYLARVYPDGTHFDSELPEKSLRERVQPDPKPVTLSSPPSGLLVPYVGAGPEIIPPRSYKQLVACLNCGYFRTITVQERRGSHGCMNCGQQMEVWEPRPERFGGLLGDGQ